MTICFWIPGIIHAFIVVSTYNADRRAENIVQAIRSSNTPSVQGAPVRIPVSAPSAPPVASTRLSAGTVAIIVFSVIGFIALSLIFRSPDNQGVTLSTDGNDSEPLPTAKAATVASEDRPETATTREETKLPATIYDEREWKSADGVRSFVGTLKKIGSGEITVEKEGGPITFPVSMLSVPDKEFLGQGITITTLDGQRHENGAIAGITADSILFVKESGPIHIKMVNLSKDLRRRLGYDPAAVENERKALEQRAIAEIKALDGLWILENAESGGIAGADRAPSHQTWEIKGNSITLNSSRFLQLRHETDANPKRLYIENGAGGSAVPVYACIYRFEGDRLIVCSDAGDSPPVAFSAGANDFTFLLRFRRS